MSRPPVLVVLALAGCTTSRSPDAAEICAEAGADALASCVERTRPDAYYVAQSEAYFDTMDKRVPLGTFPPYAELVVRWEWPPWLKLTGFTRDGMEASDRLLRLYPSMVEDRDCRAFAAQPWGRCRVTFRYDAHEGRPCPIYEEFTFNEAGEITFIEAWSDLPGLRPMDPEADPWAEDGDVARLATRLPGLGGPEGRLRLDSPAMEAAATTDPDLADLVTRAQDFSGTWFAELEAAGDALWAEGCGW
ncbi:MAG: hypothetical protein H6732_14605 [Alphaproteobacteria bacterium]|nr:hypothetical protein [Alphaproteobacteria bacterium]